MYLDTDIILGLVKQKDWLKPHIKIEKIRNPKTSVLVLIEAELVLDREYEREHIFELHERIKRFGIKIAPLEEDVIVKSAGLMKKYTFLSIFDSIHAAFSILKKETIVLSDSVFKRIEEVNSVDPREL